MSTVILKLVWGCSCEACMILERNLLYLPKIVRPNGKGQCLQERSQTEANGWREKISYKSCNDWEMRANQI